MAMVSLNNSISKQSTLLSSFQTKHSFNGLLPPSYLTLPRVPLSRFVISFASQGSSDDSMKKKKKSSSRSKEGSKKGGDLDEEDLEAFLNQLEEELKRGEEGLDEEDDNDNNDDVDDQDGITEEDLARLERKASEAFSKGIEYSEMVHKKLKNFVKGGMQVEDVVNEVEDEDEESLGGVKSLTGMLNKMFKGAAKGGRKVEDVGIEDFAKVKGELRETLKELGVVSNLLNKSVKAARKARKEAARKVTKDADEDEEDSRSNGGNSGDRPSV